MIRSRSTNLPAVTTAWRPNAPLPSKEESLRQIEEEAAKLRAESLVQVENKVANQHSQRIADQIKFHDELREAIRSFGYQAGPEIEKIAKRYDGEINHAGNWAKAPRPGGFRGCRSRRK